MYPCGAFFSTALYLPGERFKLAIPSLPVVTLVTFLPLEF